MDDEYLYAGDQTSPGRFEGRGCLVAFAMLVIVLTGLIAIECAVTGHSGWASTIGLLCVVFVLIVHRALRDERKG